MTDGLANQLNALSDALQQLLDRQVADDERTDELAKQVHDRVARFSALLEDMQETAAQHEARLSALEDGWQSLKDSVQDAVESDREADEWWKNSGD